MSNSFTTRPEIIGTFGVVSSTHWLASQVGMSVLERGGNAYDAAAAAGFVLQVVEPHLNGPGGEVPIMLWSQAEQRMRVVCGQGYAPAQASASYFQQLGLELVPGVGMLPATVPGAFGAWLTMLRDYGTWEIDDILRPAIEYARDGFPILPRTTQAILAVRDLFQQQWSESAHVWLPNQRVPRPGSLFRNPGLANTYQRIAQEATSAGTDRKARIDAALRLWYQGFVAKRIDQFYQSEYLWDCTGEKNRGLLRYDDMAQWQSSYEDPIYYDYGHHTVAKCGAWSQGPVFLQQLALLKHCPISHLDPSSPEFVHYLTEASKLAMADRLAWYGDPNFVNVPLAQLLSDDYNRQRAASIGLQASLELRPGNPGGQTAYMPDLQIAQRTLAQAQLQYGSGEPTFATLPPLDTWRDEEVFVGDTCHLAIIDKEGNMVSATPSGGWLSSSPTIAELGFSLNTRLQMTWLDPASPGYLMPGKRPSTTLSPSMALRDGQPYLAFGTPGGDQQDQWTLAFLLRHCHAGMNLQQAIDAPAWHSEHFPASFWPRDVRYNRLVIESRLPPHTQEELRQRGHDLHIGQPWSEGRISACSQEITSSGRRLLKAAANPRGMQSYAVGR